MKQKVYLETTIPSFVTSLPSRDIVIAGKQEVSREWWNNRRELFELYVSPFVIDEAQKGNAEAAAKRMQLIRNIPVIADDDEVKRIAETIIQGGLIPKKASADAFHIAVATRHGVDILLTWNCTHIANAQILKKIEKVVELLNYDLPVICTPYELMEDEDEE